MSDPRAVDPPHSDDEAAWQDLVRRFHESSPGEGGPAGTPPSGDPAAEADSPGAASPGVRPSAGTGARPGPRDHVVDEPEDDFEPPEPPPLSSAEPALALAWTGVVVSLGLALVITVFVRSAPSLLGWTLAGVFLVSAGYLASRLPRERHDDDDGAQV
ncbi:hypothetical protein GCM10011512_22130 [Tersicoccus solisilvae]|uniref:DUF308 domain-containing protein n=1 Tax=Tersicoccus solisilvae TaxID=1882339 RepID=A0ABQ1PCS7_9MICC|nr:hypothetical protein [Tersicoccus solisilvae]GGC94683.1 hypothetical protein GCM10011512_22130 [Tersicoccus solisilvae]